MSSSPLPRPSFRFHPYTRRENLEQRVVIGGERPALNKGWPDGLRKLLASAWHPDHSKRPTASQVVVALRHTRAQLPGQQGSTSARPSSTKSASRRRQTWSAPALPPCGGVGGGQQPADAAARSARSATIEGDRPKAAGAGAGAGAGAAASAAGVGDEETEKKPSSGGKPQRRFSLLSRSSEPALQSSSSYSAPRRTSWYKFSKRGSRSAQARFARESQHDGGATEEGDKGPADDAGPSTPTTSTAPRSGPKPAAAGSGSSSTSTSTSTASTRNSSMTSSARSTLKGGGENDGGGGGGQDSATGSEAIVAAWDGRTSRCAFHQGLVNKREEITRALAKEAEEQMPKSRRREKPARNAAVGSSLDNQEWSTGVSLPIRKGAPSDRKGGVLDPDSGIPAVDISQKSEETSVDVSSRSNRRSNSLGKLWPSASVSSDSSPVAAPTSSIGGGDPDHRNGVSFRVAANGIANVALIASG